MTAGDPAGAALSAVIDRRYSSADLQRLFRGCQIFFRAGVIRIDSQRMLEVFFGLRQLALLDEDFAQTVVGIREFGIDGQCAFVMDQRLGKISEFAEDDSEIVLSERILRIESHGPLEVYLRTLEVPLFVKDNAKVVVNFGVPGIERQGSLKMGSGCCIVPLIAQ